MEDTKRSWDPSKPVKTDARWLKMSTGFENVVLNDLIILYVIFIDSDTVIILVDE